MSTIDTEKVIERCFNLSAELASQINNKIMFEKGLDDTNNKISTLTGQSNELIQLLKGVGIDEEQLKVRFEKMAKDKQAEAEAEAKKNTNGTEEKTK